MRSRFLSHDSALISRIETLPSSKLTAEKAYRRRSSGFAFGTNDLEDRASHTFVGGSTFPFNSGQAIPPVPAIPFNLNVSRQRPKDENCRGEVDAMDIDTSRPSTASDVQSPLSEKRIVLKACSFRVRIEAIRARVVMAIIS